MSTLTDESLSIYQKKILDFFHANPTSNMLINALAGSGKTSTILKMLEDTTTSDIYVAFNNSIAEECKKKITNPKVKVSTLHALGLSFINYNLKEKLKGNTGLGIGKERTDDTNAILDNLKIYKIIDSIIKIYKDFLYQVFLRENYFKLYNLCRVTCTNITRETEVQKLINKHSLFIDFSGHDFSSPNMTTILTTLKQIDRMSLDQFENDRVIDFTDMLYITWLKLRDKSWEVPYWGRFTNIINDEAQDTCTLQLFFLMFIRKKDSRYVFVGDTNQAIYFWTGSDAQAFNSISNLYAPIPQFELPINYRCPVSHLKEVNKRFDIPIQPCNFAPDGEIKTINKSQIKNFIKPGDIVISRKNKWLSDVVLDLAVHGIPIYFEDREFVNNLKSLLNSNISTNRINSPCQFLVEKLEKKIKAFEKKLRSIIVKEMENTNDINLKSSTSLKIEEISHENTKIDNINFIVAVLRFYMKKHPTESIGKFKDYFNKLISGEKTNAVRLSSVHKAKGLEAPNVFVLNEGKICKDFRNSKEQNEQEINLSYISFTRSKGMLYLVREPEP